jgi:hypothetical protein
MRKGICRGASQINDSNNNSISCLQLKWRKEVSIKVAEENEVLSNEQTTIYHAELNKPLASLFLLLFLSRKQQALLLW